MSGAQPGIEVRVYKADEAAHYLPEIAALRMEVFREFPYLYEGSVENEEEYLGRYMKAPGFMVTLAFDQGKVVGASTSLPLEQEIEEITKPFREENIPLSQVLYFGESVLKSEYRGQGLGVRFFQTREQYAKDLQRPLCYFCAVVREQNHPLRPKGYQNLHSFWHNRGYKETDLYCRLEWYDIHEAHVSSKQLRFWRKKVEV